VNRISDVARLAGVSPATVSRVLNDNPTVSRDLVRRVQAAVEELDYEPNRAARNLRRRGSSVLALLVSDIDNPFFTALVRGVEEIALKLGFSVVLCNTDEDLTKESRYIAVVLAEQVAGVIISPTSEHQTDLSPLLDRGVPVVAVDRLTAGHAVDTVVSDNVEGARLGIAHLLDNGYRRIAYIGGRAGVSTSRERAAGYRLGLRQAGIKPEPALVISGGYRRDGGHTAMLRLLAQPRPPDAVLVANHVMAIGALEALREAGRRVPDDVGLVSFDDPPWAALVSPPMSVIAQHDYEIGRHAAELLGLRMQEDTRPPASIVLKPELRVRESSRRR
jgi:LacI family transcriptional regulator